MAIAYDNAKYQQNTSTSSQSYSFTVGTGDNRILLVGVETGGATFGSNDVITSVTYNGVSLTRINTVANSNRMYLYYLIAPATGANTLVVTASSSGGLMRSSPVSYSGVDQTSPIDANGTGTGSTTTMDISLTSTTDNCWMVAVNENSSGEPTASTGTVKRTSSSGGGYGFLDSNSAVTPAGSYTLQFDQPSATAYSNCSVMIKPFVEAGASNNALFAFGGM